MEKSKSIAGIVGPTIIVMVFSEMRLWNPTLYDTQIVPLIYLNGVLLFVAGLAIVRSHNIWMYGWQTLVTIIGYVVIIIGLFRMFFPQVQKAEFDNNNNSILIGEIVLILIGIFLTCKAYLPTKKWPFAILNLLNELKTDLSDVAATGLRTRQPIIQSPMSGIVVCLMLPRFSNYASTLTTCPDFSRD